jgi:hypothetical protein
MGYSELDANKADMMHMAEMNEAMLHGSCD